MRYRDGTRGFTLIELLVVIAIIAILAAILFPVFLAAKERAQQSKCINNQKQIGMAMMQYVGDNNGTFPLVDFNIGGGPDFNSIGGHKFGMFYVLEPYLKNVGVLNCPTSISDHNAYFSPGSSNKISYLLSGDPRSDPATGEITMQPLCGSRYGPPWNILRLACKSGQIRRPSRVIATQDWWMYTARGDMIPGFQRAYTKPTHMGGLTFSFADGHVRYMKTEHDRFFKSIKLQYDYPAGGISWDVTY